MDGVSTSATAAEGAEDKPKTVTVLPSVLRQLQPGIKCR
jgi:hypothetical protein